MTMREIAVLLANMGNEVKYTIRNDGGIRITYINGQRFTGSSGNTIARNMVGATISEARVKQLGKIKTPKGKWGHKKLDDVSEETKKEIRKLQRVYRKQGVKAGIPTLRKYRANIKLKGKEEAHRLLRQAARYGLGLAYTDNVKWLITKLEEIQKAYPSETLKKAIEKIEEKKEVFLEKWIKAIYEIGQTSSLGLDVASNRITSEELGRRILEIIK